MFKNALKRLLAVTALVAICCMMGTPMTASAALPAKCTHSYMLQGIEEVNKETYTHLFAYRLDVDGDGYEETIVDECTVEVTEYAYAWVCSCGYSELIENMDSWFVKVHSEENNSYHTDDE